MTVSDATNAPTAEEYSYLSHRQILVVLGGVMAGMFLAALDQSIVGTALPRIVSDLGGLEHLSWVVTAYLLTSTASTPLWGKISDLYGRRPIFQTAIVVFLVGSLVAGADSMGVLIGGRAIQGLGAGDSALALSIIGDVIPPRERGLPGVLRGRVRCVKWRPCSADGSRTGRAGGGSSGSTSRSASPRWW